MSTFDRVKKIIVDQLGVEEDRVVMEARFREELEADSLDLVELIMAFEDEFGGKIEDEDARRSSALLTPCTSWSSQAEPGALGVSRNVGEDADGADPWHPHPCRAWDGRAARRAGVRLG